MTNALGVVSLAVLASAQLAAQAVDSRKAIVAIERIWDRAPHQAFTDVTKVHGRYYCTFREGSGHVPGSNGLVRVIASDDRQNWRSVGLLDEEGVDLRDPKISQMPDGRLMLTIGGSFYEGKKLLQRIPRVSFSDTDGLAFSDPQPARIDPIIKSTDDWLWRVTWHGDVGYGAVYEIGAENRLHLVKTTDGIAYQHVITWAGLVGRPNETTLRFAPDGEMWALVRREAGSRNAFLGTSRAPYTDWTWKELPERVGGPNLVRLPDGTWIVGGRNYVGGGARTGVARVTRAGSFEWLMHVPSAGDTSYPGFLVDDDELLMSYYSTHEGKTSIYVATLRWARLVKQ